MFLLNADYWEIKQTEKKGRGVFATKDIAPGTIIGDYIGRVIRTAEEDTVETDEGLYLMYYHDQASLYPMDINAPGIHLINHSCAPNCWMYTYNGHTLFFALRHIFAGEEITVSYLLSPNECDDCKHHCHCDSLLCTHSMHLSKEQFDAWNAVNEEQTSKTKRMRIRYGKELPLLPNYPKAIPDHPIYPLVGASSKDPIILTDSKLPSVREIRKTIRQTGRSIQLPKLQTSILGVQNDIFLSENTSSLGCK